MTSAGANGNAAHQAAARPNAIRPLSDCQRGIGCRRCGGKFQSHPEGISPVRTDRRLNASTATKTVVVNTNWMTSGVSSPRSENKCGLLVKPMTISISSVNGS